MTTPAIIPVFDPQGVLRDIPEDQLNAAVKSGGMPAVKFQAPDKSIRFVPANRTQEAYGAGGSLLPFEQQDVKHPGFWLTLDDDLNKPITIGGQPDRALTHAKDFAVSMVRNLGDVSVLNIGAQLYHKLKGEPDTLKDVAGKIVETGVPMMLGEPGEIPTRAAQPEATAERASAPETSPVSAGVLDRLTDVVKRRIVGKIPGIQAAKDLDYLLHGEASPKPPAPAVPAWYGQGRYGTPVDQWGQRIPASAGPSALTGPEVSIPQPMSTTPSGEGIPRTFSGESALRQVLTGQDNVNLMRIAKSRGIDVSQEGQLKPSIADKRLVNKIVDDFSADELDEFRSNYLEQTRMGRHNFGDIGAEANKTLSMQTYFPDVKIPLATTLRTQKAIQSAAQPKFAPINNLAAQLKASAPSVSESTTAPQPNEDLSAILQDSIKAALKKKASVNQ